MDLLDVPAWDDPTPDTGYPSLQLHSREPGATEAELCGARSPHNKHTHSGQLKPA